MAFQGIMSGQSEKEFDFGEFLHNENASFDRSPHRHGFRRLPRQRRLASQSARGVQEARIEADGREQDYLRLYEWRAFSLRDCDDPRPGFRSPSFFIPRSRRFWGR